MTPLYAKAISFLAPVGFFIAETTPGLSEWTRLPLESLCVVGMGYVTVKVIPQLVRDQLSHQKEQEVLHTARLDKILLAHKEANTELSNALCEKMECQTTALTEAIREVKK